MFKHNVKYVDFNGNERSEDLYFHLSLPEVTRIQAQIGRPIEDYTKELVDNAELPKLLEFVEMLLLNSYGEKSTDGKTFIKNKELREQFEYSQAYAELFEEMMLNPDLARKFGESVADTGKQKKNTVGPKVIDGQ